MQRAEIDSVQVTTFYFPAVSCDMAVYNVRGNYRSSDM